MMPAERESWLRACDAEHDNFRAAIDHLVVTGEVEWALRLGAALFRFWEQRDHLTEGRETLARMLAMPGARCRRACARVRSTAPRCWPTSRATSTPPRDSAAKPARSTDSSAIPRAWRRRWWRWHGRRSGRAARRKATALFAETVALWERAGRRDRGGPGAEQHGATRQRRRELRPCTRAARGGRGVARASAVTPRRSRRRSTASAISLPLKRDYDARATLPSAKVWRHTAKSTIAGASRGC